MTEFNFIQVSVLAVSGLLVIALFRLGGYVLALPLRRRENSRLFLDLIETSLREGRRVEEVFLSCAKAGDRSVEFLSVPRTPFMLGMAHLFLGGAGLLITLASLLTMTGGFGFARDGLSWEELASMHIHLWSFVWFGFNVWAGILLVRYRKWGRYLAIGLSVVHIILINLAAGSMILSGNLAGLMIAASGYLIPGVVIYLLTKPEVTASFGNDGKQEHLLVTRLRELELVEALRRVPGLIEPRIVSLLAVGRELGDFKKIMPACRSVLGEATDKARTAQNHFVIIALLVMPFSLVVLPMLAIYIVPKFKSIMADMSDETNVQIWPVFDWLAENIALMGVVHGLVLLVLWMFVLAYLAGSRLKIFFAQFMPKASARLELALPWRRKRVQRDFSVCLSLLLDAGLPEPRALELSAESTGNQIIQNRATTACNDLAKGVPLPEALKRIDDTGEFQWRLTTASRAGQGFLISLRAWHDALDARAAQQEQAAAQMATTGLVFYNGTIVGLLMFGVFQFLINILNIAALW